MTLISFDDEREHAAEELRSAVADLAPLEHGLQAVTDDHGDLRAAFSRFPSGIAALCAIVDGERAGLVATSFSVGVSFDPPLVMFSVQNSSTTWPRLRGADRLGVSVLGGGQSETALRLASRTRDRFDGVGTATTASGAVLIEGAAVWMECAVLSETPAGDHHVVLLQVEAIRVEHDIEPLVYHASTFRRLSA